MPLPLDLLTKNPAPEEYTSTSEYLSLHLERLRKVHQLALARTETAAKKRERPAHTATAPSPELGDKVLLRQHLPGRVKIQDRYRDQVYQLTERPSDGSPAVIAPIDDLGNQRRVTFRELRPLVGDSLTAAVPIGRGVLLFLDHCIEGSFDAVRVCADVLTAPLFVGKK